MENKNVYYPTLRELRNNRAIAEHNLKSQKRGFKFDITIGSDNMTRKISKDYKNQALSIIALYFDGFKVNKDSVKKSVGYWKGTKEECLTITILSKSTEIKKVYSLIESLKAGLNQESILLEISPSDYEFI